MTIFNRGQAELGKLAFGAVVFVVSAAGSWVINKVLASPDANAAAVESVKTQVTNFQSSQQSVDSSQNSEISGIKQSICYSAQNWEILGEVLHKQFVVDPNCK